MAWLTAISALTPLIIAIGLGIRWLGKQIWLINRLLATQNAAIEFQNENFKKLHRFDSSVDVELDRLRERVADLERYLAVQSATYERPFVITWTKRLSRPIDDIE